jgi:hypothetical protein
MLGHAAGIFKAAPIYVPRKTGIGPEEDFSANLWYCLVIMINFW